LASFLSYYWENCRNIGGASYGLDIRKFEKKFMHLQMCGGLPANNFLKGLANLASDCFAWFSHRQALKVKHWRV
jgi:hypothetical protein